MSAICHQFISNIACNNFIITFITGTAIRLEVFRNLAPKYKTLEEAEDDFGLGIEEYLKDDEKLSGSEESGTVLGVSKTLLDKLKLMTPAQIEEIVQHGLKLNI